MRRRSLLQLFAGVSVGVLPGFRAARQAPGHVVVIGGGIIGSSIAYHLARRGARVTLCEKEGPAAGATSKSFAWINASAGKRPYHYFRLNRLSALAYRHLQAEVGADLRVTWGGSLDWAETADEAAALRADVKSQQAWGYPVQLVDDEQFQQLEPSLRPDRPPLAAAWSQEEGSIDPERATHALLSAARREGAAVEYPCEVTEIGDGPSGGPRRVRTSRGVIEADAVVIAAGVDTPSLARHAGLTVPLRDSPGLLAHTTPGEPVISRVILAPSGAMKQKRQGSLVISGGFSGRPVSDDPVGQAEEILFRAKALVPSAAGMSLDRFTVGWRPYPDDGFPVLGFSPTAPDVYVAVMHSGITLAPLVGRLAAAEILDGVLVELMEPYRPERFTE